MNILQWISSTHPLCWVELWLCLYARRMVHSASASTSMVWTRSWRRTATPYPISPTSSTAHKARFYTKIDLCHVYQLVCICEGNEWKATFCTCYGSFKWHIMPFVLLLNVCVFNQYKSSIFFVFLFDIFLTVCKVYVHMSKCSAWVCPCGMWLSAGINLHLQWVSIR